LGQTNLTHPFRKNLNQNLWHLILNNQFVCHSRIGFRKNSIVLEKVHPVGFRLY
jgi:hypothetical protein